MPPTPPPIPRALDYAASVERGAGVGTGVGHIVGRFFCGSAATSVVGFVVFASWVLNQPGGFGLEGVVLGVVLVGLAVLNTAMGAAVFVAAVMKRNSLRCAVTVRPLGLMFLVGALMPVVSLALVWVVAVGGKALFGTAPARFMGGWLGMTVLASLPPAVVTWLLTRPRHSASL
jgi:hypothetical protein